MPALCKKDQYGLMLVAKPALYILATMKNTQFALATCLHNIAFGAHRFVWYGFRAIIVLYLFDQGIEEEEIYSYYAQLVMYPLVSGVAGGLLGDLLKQNKLVSVLGGSMMTLGLLLLTITGNYALLGPVGLFVLGEGLIRTNQFASYGKLYLQHTTLLVGSFALLFLFTNLGAYSSGYIFNALGKFDYRLAFGFGTLVMLIATVILPFIPAAAKVAPQPYAAVSWRVVIILSMALLSIGYWIGIDVLGAISNSKTVSMGLSFPLRTGIQSGSVILIGAILAIAFYLSNLPKLTFMALAYSLLFSCSMHLLLMESHQLGWRYLGAFDILLGLSDVLVFSFGSSLLVRVLPSRFLALGVGLLYAISSFSIKTFNSLVTIEEPLWPIVLIGCMLIGFFGALIYAILYLIAPSTAGGRVE